MIDQQEHQNQLTCDFLQHRVLTLEQRVAELEHLLAIGHQEILSLRAKEKDSSLPGEMLRERIEEELEHSVALLQATINSTSDGIIVVAQDGGIVHYNRKFQEIWHTSEAWERASTPSEQINLLVDQVKEKERFVKGFLEEQYETQDKEYHDILELKDGRIVERYSTPYRFGGVIAGRVWSIRDVTERERGRVELQQSRGRLKAIFDNAAVGIGLLNARGHPVQVNERWAILLGYTIDEIYHVHYLEMVHPDDRESCRKKFLEMAHGTCKGYDMERRFIRKDQSIFWGHFSARAILNEQHALESIIGIITDTTERKRAEDALQEANEQLIEWIHELEQRNRDVTLLNQMGDFLQSCLTVSDVYAVVEQFAAKMFGTLHGALYILNGDQSSVRAVAHWGALPSEDLIFAPVACWALRRGQIHRVENPLVGMCCRHVSNPEPYPTLCIPLIAQGETLGMFHLRSTQVMSEQTYERYVQQATSVSERIALALANLRLRERLHYQSTHDALTGLYNRRYLQDTLHLVLLQAAHAQQTIGIVMLDIDHFKRFNDVYGHEAGDILLRELGTFFQAHIRDDDIACRYGGEEFTLIVPGATLIQTYRRAEELREGIRCMDVYHRGQPLGVVTISAGVACFPEHGTTAEAVLRVADNALLQAKAEGRDRVVVASPEPRVGQRQEDGRYPEIQIG